jgi:hypothetical protein
VNFTGSAGAAGDTWLTRSNAGSFNGFNDLCLRADILFNRFNNAKGGGLVALLNPGGKGLLLLLINNGNTDRLTLNTIDPNNGKIVEIKSFTVPLSGNLRIAENAWYRLVLLLNARESQDTLVVNGLVFPHTDPSDPDSPLARGLIVLFEDSLAELGLEQEGFVGMAAWAQLAVVNTSMTNFFATTNVSSITCDSDDS